MKKLLFIIFISIASFTMNDKDAVIKVDEETPLQNHDKVDVGCECKLCRGMQITIASNIITVLATATVTFLVNYTQCDK